MEKVYEGKTKDVFKLDNGNYSLLFKDDVTGADGVFDPGANAVGLSIEGIGKQNLLMSSHFFEILRDCGIETHYISADPEKSVMEVKAAKPFGKGVEVICRFRAVGSFIRRYGGYIEDGAKLDAYVEVTLKDDGRGDPLITEEGLETLGILDRRLYGDITDLTRRIACVIRDELLKKGLELYDIKFEFGKCGGKVILMDEIASGNMRVYRNGAPVGPVELAETVLSR